MCVEIKKGYVALKFPTVFTKDGINDYFYHAIIINLLEIYSDSYSQKEISEVLSELQIIKCSILKISNLKKIGRQI